MKRLFIIMKMTRQLDRLFLTAIIFASVILFNEGNGASKTVVENADPLSSWNNNTSKRAIVDFVKEVTTSGNPHFVQVEDRIAVFDNDGTLWPEQPMYFQLFFTIDRVREMAAQHPEWKTEEPYKSILAGDVKNALAAGEKAMTELLLVTHSGMTTEEFQKIVKEWITVSRHPRFNKAFTACTYLPMQELMDYLRANGFKTFIVSGGGIEFMRPWTQEVYGVPPEQVIGSSVKTKYEKQDGQPVLMRLPVVNFVDDKEGKPVGIQQHIGKRPIAAFGNSNGDFQMLEWTTAGTGLRLGLIVHHDDSVREWAYDRHSPVGQLDKAMDEAPKRKWVLVSMKNDWKNIFPNE